MNTKLLMSAAVLSLFALTGCDRGETPTETQEDVAEDMQDANEGVREEQLDAAGQTAEARYDMAVANAEGEHKVAVEKCEALTGNEREVCKDSADEALEQAKAEARAMRDTAQP